MEAGSGLYFFVPESLYQNGEGSVSFQSGLSTSIGLGNFLKVPIGFSYNKIQGYMVEAQGLSPEKPWFMGDSFMPYIKLEAVIPLSVFEISFFAGGAVNWNASFTALKGNMEDDLVSGTTHTYISSLDFDNPLAFGWLAGGSFTVNIGDIGVSFLGEYRNLSADLALSGETCTGPLGAMNTPGTLNLADPKLVIRGWTLGIGGSFSF